jgi:hypothetical protein
LVTNDDSKTTYYSGREDDSCEESLIEKKSYNSETNKSNRSSTYSSNNSKAIEKLKYFKVLNSASSFWENKFCFGGWK